MSIRWIRPAEDRSYRRTTPRGYIKQEDLAPEVVPFIVRRRGPRRETLDIGSLEREMAEYAMEQNIAVASIPELLVHRELTRRGLQDQADFSFQASQLGGRVELGGCVVDFLFRDRPLALRVQGEHWHTRWERMGTGASDEEQRLALIGRGLQVEDLWESTIMDPDLLEDWMKRVVDAPQIRLAIT